MFGIDPQKQAQYAAIIEAGRDDIIFFAENVLGMPLHEGQKEYLRESLRREDGHFIYKIVTLSPSNQWGKTLVEAGVVETWHCFYKKWLGASLTEEAKFKAEYGWLHASPHSNQLSRAYKYITQIVAGEFVWEVDGVQYGPNKSLIPWAIVKKQEDPYYVKWYHGAETFFRPTGEDKGASASSSPYAGITYDEACRSLHLFTEINGILLPRLTLFRGQLRMPSTPWPDSPSFMDFKEIYDKGMITDEHRERDPGYFSMGGDLYQNIFLPQEEKERLEAISDPEMRRQTIYGEFTGRLNTYFDQPLIHQVFADKSLQIERPMGAFDYILVWDPAFGKEDDSVIAVYRKVGEMYYLARWEQFRGNTVSPESQYVLVRDLANEYNHSEVIIDGSGPQGILIKSKLDSLGLAPVSINFAYDKTAILPTMKDFLSKGRSSVKDPTGVIREQVLAFGRLRAPYISSLAKQLSAYPGPDMDQKTKCDWIANIGMLAWYVEKVNVPMQSYDVDMLANIQ